MGIQTIDGHILKAMMIEGLKCLEANKDLVDSLNVFPVPDGDTGTNMMLTTLAAVKELDKISTNSAAEVAKAVSGGSLRGARGNSGVILSQIFRGFAKGMDGKTHINSTDLGQALQKAQETAYRAIMKPKEGTILTVTKYIAEQAVEFAYDNDNIDEMFEFVVKSGYEILEKTTQMLPQLRQAGVVDSGGKGLLCILEGMYRGLKSVCGEAGPPIVLEALKQVAEPVEPVEYVRPHAAVFSTDDIEFIYCTEFLINISRSNISDEAAEDKLKNELEKIGDSIVVVCDDRIVKVHVHTNHPGNALELALGIGELSNLKIENMRIQHTNILYNKQVPQTENASSPENITQAENTPIMENVPVAEYAPQNGYEKSNEQEQGFGDFDLGIPPKPIGFVAVAPGQGFSELLRELGADEVIEGGQTMNPSTEDILSAAEKVKAEKVVILPNNKNIIFTAKLAEEMSKDDRLRMIPTKTIPQGIAALISYVSAGSFEESIAGMEAAISEVKTGSITSAVRSTVVDDKEIREGDIICLVEDKIKWVAENFKDAALELIKLMVDDSSSIITIYYGADVNEDEVTELKAAVMELYDGFDVEVHFGAQPVYNYIISVE